MPGTMAINEAQHQDFLPDVRARYERIPMGMTD